MTPEEFKEDLISRSALKEEIKNKLTSGVYYPYHFIKLLDNAPTVETDIEVATKDAYEHGYTDGWKERFGEPNERPEDEWVPIKFRPLTEEEKERYPEETDGIYDCRLPDDGEEVLITTRWGAVCIDTFQNEGDTCYFEDHDDADEVTAWKHLPKPYEPEEKEGAE